MNGFKISSVIVLLAAFVVAESDSEKNSCERGHVLTPGQVVLVESPKSRTSCRTAEFTWGDEGSARVNITDGEVRCQDYPIQHISVPNDFPLGQKEVKMTMNCGDKKEPACFIMRLVPNPASSLPSQIVPSFAISQTCSNPISSISSTDNALSTYMYSTETGSLASSQIESASLSPTTVEPRKSASDRLPITGTQSLQPTTLKTATIPSAPSGSALPMPSASIQTAAAAATAAAPATTATGQTTSNQASDAAATSPIESSSTMDGAKTTVASTYAPATLQKGTDNPPASQESIPLTSQGSNPPLGSPSSLDPNGRSGIPTTTARCTCG